MKLKEEPSFVLRVGEVHTLRFSDFVETLYPDGAKDVAVGFTLVGLPDGMEKYGELFLYTEERWLEWLGYSLAGLQPEIRSHGRDDTKDSVWAHWSGSKIVAPAGELNIVCEEKDGGVVPRLETLPLVPGMRIEDIDDGLAAQVLLKLVIGEVAFEGKNAWYESDSPTDDDMLFIWRWLNDEGNEVLISVPSDLASIIPTLTLTLTLDNERELELI